MNINKDKEIKMEGVETVVRKGMGMGGNQIIMSANIPMENRKMKMKNKKKRRGQNKNQGVKFQLKKQEKFKFNKNIGKMNLHKKMNSFKKVGETETVGGGQSNTEGEENIDQDTEKTKKPKRRNNRDLKFPSVKVS